MLCDHITCGKGHMQKPYDEVSGRKDHCFQSVCCRETLEAEQWGSVERFGSSFGTLWYCLFMQFWQASSV